MRGPPSGEPVAAVVARGEAEIGFQQVAELIHVPGADFVGTVPAEIQPPTYFVGALPKGSQQPDAAVALLRFLSSAEAAAVITKAGLKPLRAALNRLAARRERRVRHDRRKIRGVCALRPPHLHDAEAFGMRAVLLRDRLQRAVARLVLLEIDARHLARGG